MRIRTGWIAGVLALTLVAAGLTGCSALGGEKWVAKVNNQPITEKDYNGRLTDIQKAYEGKGMKFDSEQGKQALNQLKGDLLEGMISHALAVQEAKNQNLNLEDPKVLEQLEQIKKMAVQTSYESWLKEQGITEAEVKSYFALSAKTAENVTLTDEQIKGFFDSHTEQFGGTPEQVKARHILVKTEDEANDVIAQLKKGGNFEQLAKEKSIEPGAKESGGQLGYFGKGQMVPEFEKVAFAQKTGTYSTAPVKTEFGYHVILVEEHKAETKVDYAKVKTQVAEAALADAKSQKFETYFTELRGKAAIEYAKGYKPAVAK